MLDTEQVKKRLNISLSQVYKIIRNGELTCYRFGRAIRVSEEQLKQYLEASKDVVVKKLPSSQKHF